MAFTFFFRDLQPLALAVEHIAPLATVRSKINIWDAGCAMGPEPYTLAMLFAEKLGYFTFKKLDIKATDIDENDTFGEIIKEGVYPEEELKRIPADIFEKYFHPADRAGYFLIEQLVKDRISFQKHNLLSLNAPGRDFSLIICKNVLLHFSREERIAVIKMFHDSLVPGGYLVMEHTQKLPEELGGFFRQINDYNQFYQKVEA